MTSEPLVVASILNWNQFDRTLDCLRSLYEQNYARLIVCVTDNHSRTFDEQTILEQFPGIKLIKNQQNLGYAAGHLGALEHAVALNAELFWVLNNDTILTDSTLPALLDAFSNEGQALYGSLSIHADGSITSEEIWGIDNNPGSLTCTFSPLSEAQLLREPLQQVANLLGCSLLIPVSVIEQHGFIDTSFFLYFEETDYCLTLLKAGVPSYLVSSSRIVHTQKASTASSPRLTNMMNYYLYRNLHRVIKSHAPGLLAIHYLKSMLKRFVFANLMNRKHLARVSGFQALGVLHAYLGVKGKYYNPDAFLDD